MPVFFRLLFACLALASVVTAQLFGTQRDCLAEVNGTSVLSNGSHHHHLVDGKASLLACYATDCGGAADASSDVAEFHTPLKTEVKMPGGTAPAFVAPVSFFVIWEMPPFSPDCGGNTRIAGQTPVSWRTPPDVRTSAVVADCVVLLV